jgi:hypothetical protein
MCPYDLLKQGLKISYIVNFLGLEQINSIYIISKREIQLKSRTTWKSNRLLEWTVFEVQGYIVSVSHN